MNIQYLPNGLKELAIKRRDEEKNKEKYFDDTHVGNAFAWHETKEGFDFWSQIEDGNFNVYKEKYSAHEWTDDYPGEYQVVADVYGNTIVAKVGDYICPPFYTAYSIGAKFHEDVDISSPTITPAVLANGYYAGEDQIPEVYEAWAKGYEYACRHYDIDNTVTSVIPDNTFEEASFKPKTIIQHHYVPQPIAHYCHIGDETKEILKDEGIKEDSGKLSYELDWEFIEAMAARMSKNKGKYEPYNWKKPIEVEKLKQSLIRHVVEIMKDNYNDDGDEFGHLTAVALNTMMLNYQLKLKQDEV